MGQKFPWYGYPGITLLLACWAGNWLFDGLRTHLLFFPQWLGFILVIDAFIMKRTGTSLIKRDLKKFVALFVLSIPVWWLFEALNLRNNNWYYTGREYFGDVEYLLLASLNFSIVIPAVFEMTELITSFQFTRTLNRGPEIPYNKITATTMIILGTAMLILDLVWPRYFFLFMWMSVYLIIEGINILLKNKSLVLFTETGNWYPIYMLALGCLCCGFFWELWNYYSYPKWIYRVPFLGFAKVFEMPILGYLGYIPFAFELYSIYMFLTGTGKKSDSFIIVK